MEFKIPPSLKSEHEELYEKKFCIRRQYWLANI